MRQRGFTIVELLIVIIVMAILLTLSVVNIRSTRIDARDAERKTDVENLAKLFESFYTSSESEGSYPALDDIDPTSITAVSEGIDPRNYQAPNLPDGDETSLAAATTTTTNIAAIDPYPSNTDDLYVYQPLDATGALCASRVTQRCSKFTFYFYVEKTGELTTQTSKRR